MTAFAASSSMIETRSRSGESPSAQALIWVSVPPMRSSSSRASWRSAGEISATAQHVCETARAAADRRGRLLLRLWGRRRLWGAAGTVRALEALQVPADAAHRPAAGVGLQHHLLGL